MRSIAGEPHAASGFVSQVRYAAAGQIDKLAATDLADPGIKSPISIRQKSHKFPVRGNGSIQLRALKIREPLEARTVQRILPGFDAQKQPPGRPERHTE